MATPVLSTAGRSPSPTRTDLGSRSARGFRLSSAVGGAFIVWGVAIGLIRLHDNSFLTHVATGNLILAHGVPRTDPYSFTAPGHPWVVESWLASVLYGAVQRLGSHGLQFLHAALTAALAGLIWVLTRPAKALTGRIVTAAAALSVGTGYWSPRPLLIALVLLAVVILMVETDRGSPWLLVPLMWLWVNVHGSWPIALAYLIARIAGRLIDRQPVGRLPKVLGASAAGVVLGALNPFGLRLLGYPLTVLTHHQAFSHIVEWESPNFGNATNAVFLGAALLGLILLVGRRGRVEDAVVVVVFLAAACLASRNVPTASLVLLPVLARGLTGLSTLDGSQRGLLATALVALWAALGVGMVVGASSRPAFDLSAYPVGEVTAMQHRGLVPGRVATQDFVGNYLELRFGARSSVFIDDRVDMYPAQVEGAYGVLLGGAPRWEAVLDRYRIDAVLWARNQPLASLVAQSPRWQVVVRDRRWIVAVRRASSGTSEPGA